MNRIFWALVLTMSTLATANAEELRAVQIYTENQLADLIKENKHLDQVVLDKCQLVEDIKARAQTSKKPTYQFLWGDMLAYGVCVKRDVELGVHYMHEAANQGLPEALEQIGRYYHIGKFMQVDERKAILYLKEAAALNNLNAQIRLGQIYKQGLGSPLDYPILYSQLHHAVTADENQHQQIVALLSDLQDKMPAHVVEKAKNQKY